ncbi:methionyl-tRNA formyltransferase [Microbacterium sediminis]|uniref:Methionyl-tRNA formyltransferase n=1 Tax=Microbacterium sediminis TaxID=904291 RepID=A0A1B9NGN7_9MICO|nr:methionyl-tRNA formyltransferase [Microbacterium sediminis]OCG75714.1 methionyl-tRNA formyltransferase [Microbacterium sediminis]QBR74108.1 methionyl-tRNA formyltransferase [Microbacterium sediminis]
MRLIFAGTPAAAVPSLRALHSSGHEIAAVVTRPDAPLGRKRVLTASPVGQAAAELGLPVIKTARLDAAATERIMALEPDLGVIVAYGGLVREPLLSGPAHGWINVHFSLLPRWRGAAPVQHTLIAGDARAGVTVFRLVPELDAGDVYATAEHGIDPDATAGQLLGSLSHVGAQLVREVVDTLAAGRARAHAQVGAVTLAPKLTLEDGRLDWHQPADAVRNRFRGVTPEPGAFTTVEGDRLKIHDLWAAPAGDDAALAPGAVAAIKGGILVGTGTAPVLVTRLQPAGRAEMPAADWFRGLRSTPRLGS